MKTIPHLHKFGAAMLALGLLPSLGFAAKIGVVPSGPESNPFWGSYCQGVRQAAAQSKVEAIVKCPPIDFSAAYQTKLIAAVAEQGIEAIIVAPVVLQNTVDANVHKALAAVAAKGVKIVVVGLAPLSGFENTGVAIDQQVIATAGIEKLVATVGENEEVGFFRTYSPDGLNPREKLAIQSLRARSPKIVIHSDVFMNDEDKSGLAQAKLLFTKHPKIATVFTSMTVSTVAMVDALKEIGLAGKVKHVGFGMQLTPTITAALEAGALTVFISQDPHALGVKAVETAVELCKGAKPPAMINVAFDIVTKDNVAALKAKLAERK